MESNVIWTPRVVLYTKLPLVSPDTEKTASTTVLQTGPLTRVCEQLIPTLVWGNEHVFRGGRNTSKPAVSVICSSLFLSFFSVCPD